MDNWFTWSEQFIKDNLAWFILLAIISGAIWGVWSSVVKEIERPSRQQTAFMDIKLTLNSEVFREIKGIVLRLLFANTLWAIILSVIVAMLFSILNRFYETVWVKLIIAFSVIVTKAIVRYGQTRSYLSL
jgi:TM2 domain-containing membrane protein YozV